MTRHLAFLGFILAAAQIDTSVIEKYKAGLEKQTTDPDQKREGARSRETGTISYRMVFAPAR
jgi:hypothetical protein